MSLISGSVDIKNRVIHEELDGDYFELVAGQYRPKAGQEPSTVRADQGRAGFTISESSFTPMPLLPIAGYTIQNGELLIAETGVYCIRLSVFMINASLNYDPDLWGGLFVQTATPAGANPKVDFYARHTKFDATAGAVAITATTTEYLPAGSTYKVGLKGSPSLSIPWDLNTMAITRIL